MNENVIYYYSPNGSNFKNMKIRSASYYKTRAEFLIDMPHIEENEDLDNNNLEGYTIMEDNRETDTVSLFVIENYSIDPIQDEMKLFCIRRDPS